MNTWDYERTAEYHRQQLIEEVEHMRLERIALQGRVYRPGLFTRTMFNFANWMISTGKSLRKRYEVPSVDCGTTRTGSFAH